MGVGEYVGLDCHKVARFLVSVLPWRCRCLELSPDSCYHGDIDVYIFRPIMLLTMVMYKFTDFGPDSRHHGDVIVYRLRPGLSQTSTFSLLPW